MICPPSQLDGADVLHWVVSRSGAFYRMPDCDPPIVAAGIAICRYSNDGSIYLFTCNPEWEVVGDWDCTSIEEAMERATGFANGETLEWQCPSLPQGSTGAETMHTAG